MTRKHFSQLKSSEPRRFLFDNSQTLLSTVKLGNFDDYPCYETCLFLNGDSEVLEQYDSPSEALAGHVKYEKMFNLVRVS